MMLHTTMLYVRTYVTQETMMSFVETCVIYEMGNVRTYTIRE